MKVDFRLPMGEFVEQVDVADPEEALSAVKQVEKYARREQQELELGTVVQVFNEFDTFMAPEVYGSFGEVVGYYAEGKGCEILLSDGRVVRQPKAFLERV